MALIAEHQPPSRLRRTRAMATGMLLLMATIFVASLTVPGPPAAMLFVRAVSEAALVGGLADWFAITALFRRPLGLPIPHTAILPANRDRIGEGLARFLDRHFLTPEHLVPELRSLRIGESLAGWLADRRHAAALAGEITRALPHVLRSVDDRQVLAFLRRALGPQLRNASLAPLLGQVVKVLTASGYHQAVLDRTLDFARDFLAQNESQLLEAVSERRRSWIPRAINREIARAVLRGAAELIEDLRRPGGVARQRLLAAIDRLGHDMSTAPLPSAGGPGWLNDPQLKAWIASSWRHGRDLLLAAMAGPSSRVERTVALMIASIGDTLRRDAEMRERIDGAVAALAVEALPWREEVIRFVRSVVHQWEPRSFAARLETAVGADLHYIRMNGTIVGGLVGGALYLVSAVLG
ncbi:MAG TPA: DUF445 domain-containing protein [Stellaceae bacterium]|nr:DUF445 domain-containing protein [Stellaceae bacterium]